MPRKRTKKQPKSQLVTKDEAAQVFAAFETYYDLGVNRSIDEVARMLGLDIDQVEEWSEIYNWDRHVQERIQHLQTAFAEHFHTQTMTIRSRLLQMVTRTLDRFEENQMGVPLDITSVADFARLAKAYETMVRANVFAVKMSEGQSSGEDSVTFADLLKSVE